MTLFNNFLVLEMTLFNIVKEKSNLNWAKVGVKSITLAHYNLLFSE